MKIQTQRVVRSLKAIRLIVLFCGLCIPRPAQAVGNWLANTIPTPGGVGIGPMLLLSDGTVMAAQNINPGGATNWYRLVPDSQGSYLNGTWTNMHAMHDLRLFFASQVLRDGRVFVAGAEFPTYGRTAEVYDPLSNTWTSLPIPSAVLDINHYIGEPPTEILPNGNILIPPDYPNEITTNQSDIAGTIIYDPTANIWSTGPRLVRGLSQQEASWVKLPDDSILTIDPYPNGTTTFPTASERYIPSLNQWTNDANLPVSLWRSDTEIGPGFLLPDGRAFFIGGIERTALYTPSGNTSPGTWVEGPRPPPGYSAADTPGAMMVNGRILCILTASNNPPTDFFEYDYLATNFTKVANPPGLTNTTRAGVFLDLPDGNILYAPGDAVPRLYIYQPDASPLPAGKPTITSITPNMNGSFHLTGTLLNGISEGATLGDDNQMNSNYPLVRLTDGSGNVYYARTFNWSSTGVQTGSKPVTTEFTLPTHVLTNGPALYSLVVVANGNASEPVTFGPVWVDFNYVGALQNGSFNFPFKTLTNGISACPTNGTIFCKGPASHRETPRITKAMNIVAYGGTVIVGR